MNRFRSMPALFGSAFLLLSVVAARADGPWPAPVPGFVAPPPGEHPRLLFRKADLPALRARAATPAGKAMVARLKFLLGGGQALPAEFNPHPPVNIGAKGPSTLKPGAFTVHHAAGFGMLYQLTGDKRYADLARQCLDKVFEGQVDRDERYSWKAPGTGFRLSGVIQAVALAYDLCYEAWPEEYRRKVVAELQTNAPMQGKLTLEALATGNKYPPSSNHYGAYIAGPGFAALAILGDPGADDARLRALLERVDASLKTLFTDGFGDGGWFGEAAGSDKTAILPGVAGLLSAMRIAAGKDWCEGAPNARMAILTRALELVGDSEAVRRPERGHYAHGNRFYDSDRARFRDVGSGWSSDGLFAIGMGALPAAYRPGLAWIYENIVEPGLRPDQRIYEARISPLHAIYALAFWPVGTASANPTGAWPLAVHDARHGYVLSRNGFTDANDVLVTGLARRGPTGYHKVLAPLRVDIWGLGLRASLGELPKKGETTLWRPAPDGSVCFTIGGQAWGVDHSRASGADGLIVCTGTPKLQVELPDDRPPLPDDALDLSGKWDGGSVVEFVQTGKDLLVRNAKGDEWMTGTLAERTATMVYGKNKTPLEGEISPSGMRIDWDNGTHWTRVGYKPPTWRYAPGDKIRSVTLKVGAEDWTVVTLHAGGTHPEVRATADGVVVGGQTVTRTAEGFALAVGGAKP